MAALWGQLVPDENNYTGGLQPYQYLKQPDFFTQRAKTTFDSNSDELQKNRPKTRHSQGIVAKVEWIPTAESIDLGYTGVMNTGSDHIIMRLSET